MEFSSKKDPRKEKTFFFFKGEIQGSPCLFGCLLRGQTKSLSLRQWKVSPELRLNTEVQWQMEDGGMFPCTGWGEGRSQPERKSSAPGWRCGR